MKIIVDHDINLINEIVRSVQILKIRTKSDLKNCGCVNCKEALKKLNGEK